MEGLHSYRILTCSLMSMVWRRGSRTGNRVLNLTLTVATTSKSVVPVTAAFVTVREKPGVVALKL